MQNKNVSVILYGSKACVLDDLSSLVHLRAFNATEVDSHHMGQTTPAAKSSAQIRTTVRFFSLPSRNHTPINRVCDVGNQTSCGIGWRSPKYSADWCEQSLCQKGFADRPCGRGEGRMRDRTGAVIESNPLHACIPGRFLLCWRSGRLALGRFTIG